MHIKFKSFFSFESQEKVNSFIETEQFINPLYQFDNDKKEEMK